MRNENSFQSLHNYTDTLYGLVLEWFFVLVMLGHVYICTFVQNSLYHWLLGSIGYWILGYNNVHFEMDNCKQWCIRLSVWMGWMGQAIVNGMVLFGKSCCECPSISYLLIQLLNTYVIIKFYVYFQLNCSQRMKCVCVCICAFEYALSVYFQSFHP